MKMETPKMDVVRFKEADVLAASPVGPVYHDRCTVANLGDGDFSNNYANAMNQDFSFDAISKGQASHLLSLESIFNIGGTNEKSLNELVNETKTDDTKYAEYNGLYEYSESAGKYIRQ